MTPDTDAMLVRRAREGDGAAFGALVRRHERAAVALAYSLVGDWSEAEDLAQEAFVRALRNLDLLADDARFGGWLRRIVFGTCVDWLRAFRPELYRSTDDADDVLPNVASVEPGALERLEREELERRVLDAVAALPPRYRVPLTLYHLDGLGHARVADALGVRESTVRSLVTRARRRLAPLLADYVEESMGEDVFEERATPRMLHVLNGDSTRMTLERSVVPGTFAVWADALHDGPVPPLDVGAERWREVRSRHATDAGWVPHADDARDLLAEWDAALERFREYDEVVIWLEHDLFDQLLLIRHLAWFADRELGATALSLICIGEYPGMPAFKGLGELNPDQLASLLGTRQPVTRRQLELGRRAFRAFTAADPRHLERFLDEEDTPPLPFLARALRRLLEEYPSTRDGLSRTERSMLSALAAGGRVRLWELIRAMHASESAYYVTDLTLRELFTRFDGERPAVTTEPAPDGGEWQATAELTPLGREVLAGRVDWVRLRGIDRWVGGVHLEGHDPAWRWDPDVGRLARA